MRKITAAVLALAVLLAGCSASSGQLQRYEASFLTLFDTVTSVVGYAENEAAFELTVREFHDELARYHKLYDIYHDYDGLVNLKTVNDHAGMGPVEVDQPIMDLLQFAKEAYALTDGAVNVALGGVLKLWHDAREAGVENPEAAKLPEMDALREAAAHAAIEDVVLDEAAGTVELRDPLLRLDVGAVGKGFAVEQVCAAMEAAGTKNLLVSVGGNVRAIGARPEGGAWVVGIENPQQPQGDYLTKVLAADCSVVSSGSYQRYYTVAGKTYHHIIDPKTLWPADHAVGVSVVCRDSGLADVLATALFNLPQDAGQALLEKVDGAEAIWVLPGGAQVRTEGFDKLVKK